MIDTNKISFSWVSSRETVSHETLMANFTQLASVELSKSMLHRDRARLTQEASKVLISAILSALFGDIRQEAIELRELVQLLPAGFQASEMTRKLHRILRMTEGGDVNVVT